MAVGGWGSWAPLCRHTPSWARHQTSPPLLEGPGQGTSRSPGPPPGLVLSRPPVAGSGGLGQLQWQRAAGLVRLLLILLKFRLLDGAEHEAWSKITPSRVSVWAAAAGGRPAPRGGRAVPAQPPGRPWGPAATSWESESRGPVAGPEGYACGGHEDPLPTLRVQARCCVSGGLGVRHPGLAASLRGGLCASGGPRRGWGGLERGPPILLLLAPPGLPALRFRGTQSKTSGPQEPGGAGPARRPTHSPRVHPALTPTLFGAAAPPDSNTRNILWGDSQHRSSQGDAGDSPGNLWGSRLF